MADAKNIRILVVEDEELLRKAIAFDFKRRGYQVSEAVNGREAYDFVVANPVDIVLTDVRMPGGDGVELLKRLKARDSERPVVMIMTGFADLTLEQALDEGADTVFQKPFDRHALVAVMQEALVPRKDTWSQRKCQRIPAGFNVEIQSSGGPVIKGTVHNLSRGGFYLSLTENLPELDSKVSFKMTFENEPRETIEGTVIVRRVNSDPLDDETRGCALQFDGLDKHTQQLVNKLINDLKTTTFLSNLTQRYPSACISNNRA